MSYSDMESTSSSNGVPVGGGGREPPKSRVSEIITLLIDEISQGIKNISSLPKLKVIRDIEQIREESFRASRAPEAEFALKLFRKYADVAHSYKVKCDNAEKGLTSAGEVIVPSYLYETTMEPVAGFGALNHNKFWLRAATCLFCFLCYVIMGTTPNIQYAYVYPSSVFRAGCQEGNLDGYFDFRAYQLVLALAVLEYAHSFIFTVYYVLPVDSNNNKFIPGSDRWCGSCLTNVQVKDAIHATYSFCKTFARLIEAAVDILFLILVGTAVVISSIVLEAGVRFDLGEGYVAFFTVGTFYSTYSHTYPVCVDEDPSPKIRAALAMMYLALILLALSTQLSVRAVRYELRLRERTNQEASITFGKKSRGEIELGLRADEERGARSLVSNEDRDNDIEEVTL